MSKVKVLVDKNCSLYYNGKHIIDIIANKPSFINVPIGKYLFEFKTDSNQNDSIFMEYKMNEDNIEDSIEICLPIQEEENPILNTLIHEANLGNLNAQLNLGDSYYKNQNYVTAKYWYELAAQQNNMNGYYNAGSCCYSLGLYENSFNYFMGAANLGSPEAKFIVGDFLIKGVGVEKDFHKGLNYIAESADLGYQKAIDEIERYFCPFELDFSNIQFEKKPYYMFFDTETTGVPDNYNAPITDLRNWPRLVQLAWIICDENGEIISKEDHIIKPNGFNIPSTSTSIHGISTEMAIKNGKDLKEILNLFSDIVKKSEILVGHNISFDVNIVGAELIRCNMDCVVSDKKTFCTMKSSVELCKIPSNYGYKWPKLNELHIKLFGHDFDEAHNAAKDIEATMKCFFKMKEMSLV